MICLHWQSLQINHSGGLAGARGPVLSPSRRRCVGKWWFVLAAPAPRAGGGWWAKIQASGVFARLAAADLPPKMRTWVYTILR